MPNKQLVIDSEVLPNGSLDQWSNLGNTQKFIDGIKTQELTKGTNIGSLVSGIPTAFARVDLFAAALSAAAAGNSGNSGARNLMGYYTELVDEWRGFIACIGLDYTKIKVKKITLEYSDGGTVATTANIYEPKGAFGNMLLERRLRWCEQNVAENQQNSPYIDIIKYDDKVVGATAPECLVFTSSSYHIDNADDRPWVNYITHRFTDPLKSNLTAEQVSTLYAYVNHLITKIPDLQNYYSNLPEELQVSTHASILQDLAKWLQEIKQYADDHGYTVLQAGIPPVDAVFTGPFADLFKYEDVLYGREGQISESSDGSEAFDPKKLLLPSTAQIARIHLGPKYSRNLELLRNLPVYVLPAALKGSPGEYTFFALPMSALGLNTYGQTIGNLVGMGNPGTTVNSRLSAVYDSAENTLEVTLSIQTIQGNRREYRESYSIGANDGIKSVTNDIILWPNFISKEWNRYYLFSELPHNTTAQTYSAYPLVGDTSQPGFPIMTDEETGEPITLARNGKPVAANDRVKAELLVLSSTAVANNAYKYEIYSSDHPFKGVRLVSPTGAEGGYLLVHYSTDPSSQLPRDLLGNLTQPTEVNLGVDFGSTNTSIAFATDTGHEEGFEFTNQRVSLMGNELAGATPRPRENQIFFFQGSSTPVPSNAIKSVLTLHDELRLPQLKESEDNAMRLGKEVIGGFPSFANNLPVQEVSNDSITLRYPVVGLVKQAHNMKWDANDIDNARKMAFLRTLMLQVYARLFSMGYVPTRLRWSYPSSMQRTLVNKYARIWATLNNLQPVLKRDGTPYPLDVSIFDGGTINLGNENAFGELKTDTFGGFGSGNAFGTGNAFGSAFGEQAQEAPAQPAQPQGGAFAGFGSGFAQPQQPQAPAQGGFGSFGGFGTQPAANQASMPDLKPDDPNRCTKYEPTPLNYTQGTRNDANNSLTEATAVANFTSAKFGSATRDMLTLCFDIGGSTTDISALFMLRNAQGNVLTMIKQNSLRFAAQRVSRATAYVPGFENVLRKICQEFDIQMLGLNVPPRSYTPQTAPYFFDQIVDRLTVEQLPEFYRIIAAECPQLMWVNMYVTGLLCFYAGQIAYKLVDDILHTDPSELIAPPKPKVLVTFAGKGSRLLQWLTTTSPQFAKQYYEMLFLKGFGGIDKMRQLLADCQLALPDGTAADIKYEVSKGLAKGKSDLYRPRKEAANSEIIGETGFAILQRDGNQVEVPDTNTITPEMIEQIGIYFSPVQNDPCKKFVEFCSIFYDAARQMYGLDIPVTTFTNGFANLNIVQYVQNLPEYKQAKNDSRSDNGEFDFVAPVIIFEGMKFLETSLLPAL